MPSSITFRSIRLPSLFAGLLLAAHIPAGALGGSPLIELAVPKEKYQGRVLFESPQSLWLMQQDGRLREVSPQQVQKRVQISTTFRGWSPTLIRDKVQRELGSKFIPAASRHYVVFAKESATARKYADIFEKVYNDSWHYFSVRGFKLTEPEFGLVAIVFPSRDEFVQYASAESVKVSPQMRGYYLSTSNRVALYEQQTGDDISFTDGSGTQAWGAVAADLKSTIVHEGTHQVAFNVGLHARLGANPKWVVEGLATVFETPGVRAGGPASSRLNPERYVWFGNYSKERRKPKSLLEFIADDSAFDRNALDAYSEAWALSFFLIETRPRDYGRYLSNLARRDTRQEYSAEERVADFQGVFGKESALLEAQYLRFVTGLRR